MGRIKIGRKEGRIEIERIDMGRINIGRIKIGRKEG